MRSFSFLFLLAGLALPRLVWAADEPKKFTAVPDSTLLHHPFGTDDEKMFRNPEIEIAEKGQRLVGQIEMPETFGRVPWWQHIDIVSRCDSLEEALFYVKSVLENGWSRPVLNIKIDAGLFFCLKCYQSCLFVSFNGFGCDKIRFFFVPLLAETIRKQYNYG